MFWGVRSGRIGSFEAAHGDDLRNRLYNIETKAPMNRTLLAAPLALTLTLTGFSALAANPVPVTYKNFVYSINYSSTNITRFAQNATTGQLSAPTSFATTTNLGGSWGGALGVGNKYLYAVSANTTYPKLATFAITKTTGALTEQTATNLHCAPNCAGEFVTLDTGGTHLYVAVTTDAGVGSVEVYDLSATTGLPTWKQSVVTGQQAAHLAFDTAGTHAYVADFPVIGAYDT